MEKIFLITTILFLSTISSQACCAEKDYRLFPVGEIAQTVIFIEFNLFRNCNMGPGDESTQEFWTKGTVNLVSTTGDSLNLIQTIDTVNVKECTCSYDDFYQKTAYESHLATSYQKALTTAKRMKGFQMAKPKHIVFNDTLNTQIREVSTDSSYLHVLKYKELITIDLGLEDIISCFPNKVAEIRTYETHHFTVTVLRLRCRLLEEEAVARNKKRFKQIASAFWKEQAQWHGVAKDYWVIMRNERR